MGDISSSVNAGAKEKYFFHFGDAFLEIVSIFAFYETQTVLWLIASNYVFTIISSR
jgi:hypothetical protein